MTGRLSGKAALIIGAGSIGPGWGNGKATAVLFAREGAKVFCADLNEEAAAETAQIIKEAGGVAVAMRVDATKSADLKAAADNCVERFGGIDVLHNNVGIVEVGGVVDLAEEDWDRVFDVNLKSCFLAMKHVIPQMEKQGGGSIINISSITSIRCTEIPYASYYASKAAMNHLTRATAMEFAARNVRVNAILPGLMKTPMVEHSSLAKTYSAGDIEKMWRIRDAQVPMGHMGEAWDVAHAALYLASDDAKYVTGIELPVDGGITLKMT